MFAQAAEQALAAIYATFGRAATYTPPAGGPAVPCIVLLADANDEHPEQSGRPIVDGKAIKVRKAQLATVERGGKFAIDGTSDVYQIVGKPLLELPAQLEWLCMTA